MSKSVTWDNNFSVVLMLILLHWSVSGTAFTNDPTSRRIRHVDVVWNFLRFNMYAVITIKPNRTTVTVREADEKIVIQCFCPEFAVNRSLRCDA